MNKYPARDVRLERALTLVERLMKMSDDKGLRGRAVQIRDRLMLPMSVVLDKMPGHTIAEKAKRLGISRQAYYGWLQGVSRPSARMSKKLAELTGYKAEEIRGRTPIFRPSAPPPRSTRASRSTR